MRGRFQEAQRAARGSSPRGQWSNWGQLVYKPPFKRFQRQTANGERLLPENLNFTKNSEPEVLAQACSPRQLRATPASPERRSGRGCPDDGPSPGPRPETRFDPEGEAAGISHPTARPQPRVAKSWAPSPRPAFMRRLHSPHQAWQARVGSVTPAALSPARPQEEAAHKRGKPRRRGATLCTQQPPAQQHVITQQRAAVPTPTFGAVTEGSCRGRDRPPEPGLLRLQPKRKLVVL